MTTKHPGTDADITTGHVLSEHLSSDGLRSYRELFVIYRSREIMGELSNDDARTWWSSILDLLVEYGVSLFAVEQDFIDRAPIRSGTHELFDMPSDNWILAVILSAGIQDVTENWRKQYGADPSLVPSTALRVDGDGVITCWNLYRDLMPISVAAQ